MQVRTTFVFVFTVCLLAIASAARASIVFDGGGPDQQNIFFADSDYSWTSSTNNVQTFILSGDSITGANWWGGCLAAAGGGRSAADTTGTGAACAVTNFTLTFYDGAGAGATPGNVVASLVVVPTQTLTGQSITGGIPEYLYSASFGPLLLPAGNYLFGLTANLPGTITWGWETTPAGEAQHFQFNDHDATEPPTGQWQAPPNALAFNLTGPDDTNPPTNPVPEPATLSLVAVGLAGAALRKRRAAAKR